MRLIDADAIKWDKCEDANGNPVYILDKRDIDAQPTAYDLVSVITELSALKTMYFLTIANTNNEALDIEYEKVGNALDKAIEIVKGCGLDAEN